MKKRLIIIFMLLIIISLTGCTPNDGTYTLDSPAGFWWGMWHGWIAGINLIRSLFNPEIGIYETINNGGWYNFGFLLGISTLSSSGSRPSRNRSKYSK